MKELDQVQVGDELLRYTSRDVERLIKVVHVTKTQIVVGRGGLEERFRKKDGRLVGHNDPWYFVRIKIPTAEDHERLLLKSTIDTIKNSMIRLARLDFKGVGLASLRKLHNAVKEAEKELEDR